MFSKMEDKDLIELAVAGNDDAFSELCERYYMLVYKIAFKWCGIRENAEDITQDTLIKLSRNIKNFRFDSEFTTWLYRITVNVSKDHHKKNKTRNEMAFDDGFEMTSGERNQEESLIAQEIYKVIDKLPIKLKEAVLLVAGEGMNHKEAADILDCAETTISWRMFQAKKQLKKYEGRF